MKTPLSDFSKENYSKLYAAYFSKLVRFSQAYVMSRCDAENIVQDIFLYLWEHWEQAGSPGNVPAFLFTSVKNRCIDFLRKQTETAGRKHPLSEVHENEWKLKLYSLQQLDESRLNPAELETLVAKAIASLPERCREIFVMSRMEGLHHREIATRLHISTNTVEGQIGIALKKLRAELKDYVFILLFII
ncbi:MAG: RNA polymerase sigma-70 factor [Tannerella sp.]|nr:RNA polymerase sigma-70 factor [Tannerella sp.]